MGLIKKVLNKVKQINRKIDKRVGRSNSLLISLLWGWKWVYLTTIGILIAYLFFFIWWLSNYY